VKPVKSRIPAVLIGALLATLLYLAYSKHLDISVAWWHWRHGNSISVGKYEVPVPKHWLVDVEASGLTFLTDTRGPHHGRVSEINVITVDSLPMATNELDSWKSYKEEWLRNNGVPRPEERSLRFGDERVACLGGHEFHEVMKLPDATDLVSVDCLSSGNLHLMFVGSQQDLEVFYSIIPLIRKH
jgi:hypothetical protein